MELLVTFNGLRMLRPAGFGAGSGAASDLVLAEAVLSSAADGVEDGLADLVHRKGLAAWVLWDSMKTRMAFRSSVTPVNTPRRRARRSNWPNQVSTALSHDALVGVKCRRKRGCAAKKSRTASVVCVLLY